MWRAQKLWNRNGCIHIWPQTIEMHKHADQHIIKITTTQWLFLNNHCTHICHWHHFSGRHNNCAPTHYTCHSRSRTQCWMSNLQVQCCGKPHREHHQHHRCLRGIELEVVNSIVDDYVQFFTCHCIRITTNGWRTSGMPIRNVITHRTALSYLTAGVGLRLAFTILLLFLLFFPFRFFNCVSFIFSLFPFFSSPFHGFSFPSILQPLSSYFCLL